MADDWVSVGTAPAAVPAAAPAADQGDWIPATPAARDASASQPTQPGGTFENIIAGVNSAIAEGIGSPVDLANRIMGRARNVGEAAVNVGREAMGQHTQPLDVDAQADFVRNPVGGSESIKQAMGTIGANPDAVPISSDSDRIARAVGAGVLMMAAPEVFSKDAPGMLSTLLRMGRTVPAGIGAGAGSEIAREIAPEKLKPVAEMVGSMAGGGAGALATEGPAFATRTLLGPVTESAARQTAADTLAGSATDLDAARAALARGNYEFVPGSKPTTFQVTGDMGIGSQERAIQNDNPALFNERRAQQNTARRNVLDTLQTSGDPADLAAYVKSRLNWLDQQTQSDVENATRIAQQRTEALGGNQHPEIYGAKFRQEAQAARDIAKARETALWNAIDPDGNLTVSASPISTKAQEIINGLPKTAKPIAGEESDILTTALGLDAVAPFRDIAALRSRVNEAMNDELSASGRTQTYARLSRLRGAIEDGINGAAQQQAEQSPDALRQGLTQFEQDARSWAINARARSQGAGTNAAGGTGGVPSMAGTQSEGGGGLGTPSGNQSLPATPTFDDAARERLKLANAATRYRVDTYDSGTVGKILQNTGRADLYQLPEASVGQRIFRPGPAGYQDVTAYLNAVGPDVGIPTLTDYAAMALRRAAGKDDGSLDAAKATNWLRSNQDALRALPGDVRAKFENAATASDVVADAIAARKRILDNYQTGVFAKVAGLDSADDVTRTVGNIFNSGNRVQQMSDLAIAAQRNPDALSGLRKAVADYISRRFVSNTEAGTSATEAIKSDQFQTFMKQNSDALRTIFTKDEVASMQSVADDLQRANRSLTAIKIPGQSNTAQDIAAMSGAGKQSVLSKVMSQGVREAAGAAAGAAMSLSGFGLPVAAATWFGVRTLASLRAAGIQRTNDILREALLNPDLAKALLTEAAPKGGGEAAIRIRNALVRSGVYGASQATTP